MSTIACQQFEEALLLSASGEPLPEPLRRHLAQCDACRNAYDRLRATVLAFNDALEKASPPPPHGLHTRLIRRLQMESVPGREARLSRRWGEFLLQIFSRRRHTLSAVGLLIVSAMLVVKTMDHAPRVTESEQSPPPAPPVSSGSELTGQPAGPVELRRALLRSFSDFEELLRRNDRLLAARDPLAVPARPLPNEP